MVAVTQQIDSFTFTCLLYPQTDPPALAKNMKNIEAREDFDPDKEVPSLKGKVLFISGGMQLKCL